ncbi:hypothetical protein A3K63_04215 [Candidatus Micrarchaeota archaeon RBG_16_49_10]|nr:MAG: hypothetical protein A3K63_04215 [Candidatus Micrarchaeota archaeon RBG_16_49_10]
MAAKLSTKRHFKTFLYVLFIFLLGVFVGNIITGRISSQFSLDQERISNYLLSMDVQMSLFESNICRVDVFKLTEDKVTLGKQLTVLEANSRPDDPELISLKTQYTLLSIRQWLLVERIKKDCSKDITTVLFFYSNDENKGANEDQGYILDYIYDKYPDFVVTYAMDVDIDTPALIALKDIYDIETTPTLVVNGERLEGLQPAVEIEKRIFTS